VGSEGIEVTELNREKRGAFTGNMESILRKERVEEWKYELREIVRVQPPRVRKKKEKNE